MPVCMFFLTVVMVVRMLVPVTLLILVVRVHRASVNSKLHPLDVLPLPTVEVHVEIAEFQLGKLPLQGAGFDAEIAQRAHSHVAADAGGTIEEENSHEKDCVLKVGC